MTEELARSRYALLRTYRRDGREVATPVWIVGLGGTLGIWTARDSGKVKRIRHDGKVSVATCDARGRHAGPAHPGRATILDSSGTEAVRAEIRRKYGLLGRLTLLLSRVRRGREGTVGIRIAMPEAQ